MTASTIYHNKNRKIHIICFNVLYDMEKYNEIQLTKKNELEQSEN